MSETDENGDGAPRASETTEPTGTETKATGAGSADAPAETAATEAAAAATQTESEATPSIEQASAATAKPPRPAKRSEGFIGRHFFTIIAVILLIEVFVYGKRGDLEICVGKDKTHDLALMGQARTDENRVRFPQCEQRENLSMMSHYDENVSEAKKTACRKITQLRNRGESPSCIKSSDGWRFRVEGKQVWPWDKRLWKSMLHLE